MQYRVKAFVPLLHPAVLAGGCSALSNTYLTSSLQLDRLTSLATDGDCCQACSSKSGCELWSYCPANASTG